MSSLLTTLTLSAAMLKQAQSNEKANECEGILAFISRGQAAGQDNAENRNNDGEAVKYAKCLAFQRKHAHFFQKLPYYQCSLAICNEQQQLEWHKYTSKGEVESS